MNKRVALLILFALSGCAFSDVSHLRRQNPQTFQDKRDSNDQPIIFDGKQKVSYRPQAVQQVHYQSSFIPNAGSYVVSSAAQPVSYSKPGSIEYAPSSFLKDGGVQYASGGYRGPLILSPQPHTGQPTHQGSSSKPPGPPPGPPATVSSPHGHLQQFSSHSHGPPTGFAPLQVQEYSAVPHRSFNGGPVQYTFAPHQSPHYPQQIQYAIAIPADYDRHYAGGAPIHATSAYAIPAHMLQFAYAQGPPTPHSLKQSPAQPNQHQPQNLSVGSSQHQYPQYQIIAAIAPPYAYGGKGTGPSHSAIYAAPSYYNPQQQAIAFGLQPFQFALPQVTQKHSVVQTAPPSSTAPQSPSHAQQNYQSLISSAHQNSPVSYTRFSQTLQNSPQLQQAPQVHQVQVQQAQPKISAPVATPTAHIYPTGPHSQQVYQPAKLSYALIQDAPAAAAVYSNPGVIHYGTHLFHPSLPGRLVAAPAPPTAAGPQHTQSASANNVVKYP